MKDNVSIAATESTPALEFNMQQGILSLKGKSIPQDPTLFFEPLMDLIDTYVSAPAPSSRIIISLEYFNTPSAKYLQEIFQRLEQLAQKGHSVSVEWCYDSGDVDMLQAGKDYQGIVQQLSFSFMEITEG